MFPEMEWVLFLFCFVCLFSTLERFTLVSFKGIRRNLGWDLGILFLSINQGTILYKIHMVRGD